MSMLLATFRNLCGARVILRSSMVSGEEWFEWNCLGCSDGVSMKPGTLKENRDQANEHASTCRATRRRKLLR